jgi:hypothetical protein
MTKPDPPSGKARPFLASILLFVSLARDGWVRPPRFRFLCLAADELWSLIVLWKFTGLCRGNSNTCLTLSTCRFGTILVWRLCRIHKRGKIWSGNYSPGLCTSIFFVSLVNQVSWFGAFPLCLCRHCRLWKIWMEHRSGCSRSSLVSVPICSILGNFELLESVTR